MQLPWRDTTLEDEMSLLQSIVKTIRSIRQEYNLTRAKPEGIFLSVLSVCIGHAMNVRALPDVSLPLVLLLNVYSGEYALTATLS